MKDKIYFSVTDMNFVVKLAGCSLAKTPGVKDSWIEAVGGELPGPICEMAKDIHEEKGRPISEAIAIAVSQAKKLAVTSKDAKIRAKYSAAVAAWERLKAKAHK